MADPIVLVVGLGNPGPRYADTRHNAGFWLVDRVADQRRAVFRRTARFHGEVAEIDLGHRLWLLKPETYMNRSGQAVAAFAGFYRYSPHQVLVAHDDLDLPPGTVRLKRGGGHGGHNGLRDIVAQLGSPDFLRLRLGVGHPGPGADVVGYVLSRTPAEERRLIDEAIDRALALFPRLAAGEVDRVMNVLNSRQKAGGADQPMTGRG